jgi:hypothetical protein
MGLFMRIQFLATAALLAITSPAQAGTVFDVSMLNQDVAYSFNGFNTPDGSGGAIDGLGAKAVLRLTSIDNGAFGFTFSIDNLSTLASRVSVFGFDTQPDVQSATVASAAFPSVTFNGNVPNVSGTNSFRTCFSGSNCAGGGNSGVAVADPIATGSFVLRLANNATSLELDRMFVRYQGITGLSGVNSATGFGTAVPEPATWAMMIGGFALIGAAARRRARSTNAFA